MGASEVVALKVSDIDSQLMTLRIEQGKGRKDLYAMLSPVLLERLRVWWRVSTPRARCSMAAGCSRDSTRSTRSAHGNSIAPCMPPGRPQRSISACQHIRCATAHLLEQTVDIRVIQVLPGKKKLETTTRYTRVASDLLREVIGVLENLSST